jgi:hypothetical protein
VGGDSQPLKEAVLINTQEVRLKMLKSRLPETMGPDAAAAEGEDDTVRWKMDNVAIDGTLVSEKTQAGFGKGMLEKLSLTTKALLLNSALFRELDMLEEQMEEDGQLLDHKTKIVAGIAFGSALSALAAYFIWALRGLSLAASAVTAMPVWRFFDPLAVVRNDDNKLESGRLKKNEDTEKAEKEEKILSRLIKD